MRSTNGAEDPHRWRPVLDCRPKIGPLEAGDRIPYRYGVWRVVTVRPYEDVDLPEDDRARMDAADPRRREEHRPYHVIAHLEHGPNLARARRLHDGTREISLTIRPALSTWGLDVMAVPYRLCSCHAHPWPCLEMDRAELAREQEAELARSLATTTPGVCAHCLNPITTRQRSLTFPEPSLIVPGAVGPTFHAGRGECWVAARRYEIDRRLPAYPGVIRLASCPGWMFVHERARPGETFRYTECTAGADCTGLHGPAGVSRDSWCVTRYHYNPTGYPTPLTDCGHPDCLGREIPDGDNARAGDLMDGNR